MIPTPHPTHYRRSHHRSHTIGSAQAMNMPLPPPYTAHGMVAPQPPPYPVVAPPHPSMLPHGAPMAVMQFPPQVPMGYAPQVPAPPQPMYNYYGDQPASQRRESYSHSHRRRESHGHVHVDPHAYVHAQHPRLHESHERAHRERDPHRSHSRHRHESREHGHRERGHSSARCALAPPKMITSENMPFPVDKTPIRPEEIERPRGRSHARRVSFSNVPVIIPDVTVPAPPPAPVVQRSTSRQLAPPPPPPLPPAVSYPQRLRRRMSLPAGPQPAPLGNSTNAFGGREWIHVSELGWLEGVYGTNKLRKSRRV